MKLRVYQFTPIACASTLVCLSLSVLSDPIKCGWFNYWHAKHTYGQLMMSMLCQWGLVLCLRVCIFTLLENMELVWLSAHS